MLWVLGVVDLVRFVRWMLVFCWLVNLCVVRAVFGVWVRVVMWCI